MRALKPIAFRDGENIYRVTAAYGPWKTSGSWWSAGKWDVEEWDVLAESKNGASIACLLVCDNVRNKWQLEAFYD
jgi:protein ImuB